MHLSYLKVRSCPFRITPQSEVFLRAFFGVLKYLYIRFSMKILNRLSCRTAVYIKDKLYFLFV